MSSFTDHVYQIVSTIPGGWVMTYGQIADLLEKPGAARAVGNVLHKNPYPSEQIPCHRVVNRHGRLAKHFGLGGILAHKEKLEKEGVIVSPDNQVDLARCFYQR